jgi:hypothetical protein
MLNGANGCRMRTLLHIVHQGNYALVEGDKLYMLENWPGYVLDALAGKKAQVTGSLVGTG